MGKYVIFILNDAPENKNRLKDYITKASSDIIVEDSHTDFYSCVNKLKTNKIEYEYVLFLKTSYLMCTDEKTFHSILDVFPTIFQNNDILYMSYSLDQYIGERDTGIEIQRLVGPSINDVSHGQYHIHKTTTALGSGSVCFNKIGLHKFMKTKLFYKKTSYDTMLKYIHLNNNFKISVIYPQLFTFDSMLLCENTNNFTKFYTFLPFLPCKTKTNNITIQSFSMIIAFFITCLAIYYYSQWAFAL